MNGRPLLKCLSITFECLLSLTSKRHTRWAHTHKQEHTHTRGSISVWTLCTGEVVFSWGAVGFFLIRTCSFFWWFAAHSSRRRDAVGTVSLVIQQHHVKLSQNNTSFFLFCYTFFHQWWRHSHRQIIRQPIYLSLELDRSIAGADYCCNLWLFPLLISLFIIFLINQLVVGLWNVKKWGKWMLINVSLSPRLRFQVSCFVHNTKILVYFHRGVKYWRRFKNN